MLQAHHMDLIDRAITRSGAGPGTRFRARSGTALPPRPQHSMATTPATRREVRSMAPHQAAATAAATTATAAATAAATATADSKRPTSATAAADSKRPDAATAAADC